MRRALAVAVVVCLTLTAQAQDNIPGQHGTLNAYRVGMNDGTSHWVLIDFRMFDDGVIKAPIRLESDSLIGFCGSVEVQIRDRSNHVLDSFVSDEFCMGGKKGPHAYRTRSTPWEMRTTRANAQAYAHLYIIPHTYSVNTWGFVEEIYKLVEVAGKVAAVVAAF